jgi:hypothetical protein
MWLVSAMYWLQLLMPDICHAKTLVYLTDLTFLRHVTAFHHKIKVTTILCLDIFIHRWMSSYHRRLVLMWKSNRWAEVLILAYVFIFMCYFCTNTHLNSAVVFCSIICLKKYMWILYEEQYRIHTEITRLWYSKEDVQLLFVCKACTLQWLLLVRKKQLSVVSFTLSLLFVLHWQGYMCDVSRYSFSLSEMFSHGILI